MRWSLFFLSAGEETLSSLMGKVGQKTNAGQEIRLADIEADAGAGMGLFETLHEQPTPAKLALALKEAISRSYGAVGMAWLRKVVTHLERLVGILPKKMQEFVERVTNASHSAQIQRVASPRK